MGIGAGYGGSLKGSDGFNQSAFGRASQTAGQNMNKGLNYSPTLPQHDSGGSQGYTRSVLSEGNITIGGKKTSARALGIHTDSATAHHSADSVPDLQKLLDKQQTVAQSTAAIHSAVGTYRGNRAKAAAEELEKQQAAHEGSLKERNDGSYEHYSQTKQKISNKACSKDKQPDITFLRCRLIFAHTFSIGFNSGEYGGSGRMICPALCAISRSTVIL